MPKFRKKPVVIEAWSVSSLLEAATNDFRRLPQEVRDAYEAGRALFLPSTIEVHTLEGWWMVGNRDDMLIRGVAGELYPCKPDIFAQTYEPAEE